MKIKILSALVFIFLNLLINFDLKAQVCENCGIGTNSPGSKLEIKACGDSTTTSALNVTDSSGTSLFFIRDDGKIGIGTILPSTKLDMENSETGGIDINNLLGDPRISYQINGTSKFTLGVDSSDASKFKIGTTAVETDTRLTIDGSGNTGVGTTAPASLFSVGSSSQFQVNSSGDIVKIKNVDYLWPSSNPGVANYVLTNSNGTGTLTWSIPYWSLTGNAGTTAGTNFIGTTDNVDLVIKTDGLEKMRVMSGGNVGIGATAPSSLFSVGSSSQFQVNSSGDIITINNLGGYKWPTSASGHGVNGSVLTNDGTGTLTWTSPTSSGWSLTGNAGTTVASNFIGTTDNVDLVVKTNSTEKLRVMSGGNVGIGTTAPASALSIGGAGNAAWKVAVYNSVTASPIGVYAEVPMPTSGAGYGLYGKITSGNGFAYGTFGSSYNSTATSAGRAYGVYGQAGNASSGYNYGVYGKHLGTNNGAGIFATDNASGDASVPGSYAAYFAGKIRTTNDSPEKPSAGSWTGYSDQRLKKDITAFSDGLNVIKNIDPVFYKFNGIGGISDSVTHIGIVAQNIQSIAPYCIKSSKIIINQDETSLFSNPVFMGTDTLAPGGPIQKYKADVLMYNPDGLFYIMVNSIKELDVKNTALEAIVNAQNIAIEDLKARVAILENQ